jgi:hypothetical protein
MDSKNNFIMKKELNKNSQALKKRNKILKNAKKAKLEEQTNLLIFSSKISELKKML